MAPPLLAHVVLERLLAHPSLRDNITWDQLQRFMSMTRRLWTSIMANRKKHSLPEQLPISICNFLAAVMDLNYDTIQLCWIAFGDLAACMEADGSKVSDDDLFRVHASDHGIGAESIYPPMKTCPHPECNDTFLGEPRAVESRLYTLRRGVLPIFSISTYCRHCFTRYYHNYSVQNAQDNDAQRVYYEGVPDIIHVAEQSFIEPGLCGLIEIQMALSHSSAGNIAEIYNMALGRSSTDVPSSSRLSQDLHDELVIDAFFLHALLRDHNLHHTQLSLPHNGWQRTRFNTALDKRNYSMAGTGQDMWPHACGKCMKTWTGKDGCEYYMTAGVCDGVTVGHPCCSVHECKIRLRSTQDRFCPEHMEQRLHCCVQGCNTHAESGHLTCRIPAHRTWEDNRDERSTSMFQLRRRLQRFGVSEIPPAGSSSNRESSHYSRDPPTVNPPSTSNVKGSMSRRWTHNEQLFVRCCGIILSRATFYGSEGVSGVKDFLKCTFPHLFPNSLPCYIFFDNNCNLLKHLIATDDHYFDRTGLPVDVFHAHNKHHESDVFCRTHCNPAMFRELIAEDGSWVFNSSAAEQANVWFGGFQSIVREMPESRYNFYLDEMISIRNRHISRILEHQGHTPHFQTEELLTGYVVST